MLPRGNIRLLHRTADVLDVQGCTVRQHKSGIVRIRWIYIPLVNTENAPASSESLVRATVEHASDTHLTECRGTHDTRFDGDVKRCVREGVRSAC